MLFEIWNNKKVLTIKLTTIDQISMKMSKKTNQIQQNNMNLKVFKLI